MPGNPEAKIKRIADLVEWHKELSDDFDKALPNIYRFNGVTDKPDTSCYCQVLRTSGAMSSQVSC